MKANLSSANLQQASFRMGYSDWGLLALLCCLLVVHSQSFGHMVRVWTESAEYSHGWLIVPITAFLVWRKRQQIFSLPPSTSPWGFVLILGAMAMWLAGDLAQVKVVKGYGVVLALIGVVLLTQGVKRSWAMCFPLVFLLFMVPAGEWLNQPMMDQTAAVTVAMLRASGIPVFQEGLHFTLPTGKWSVVEACSGFRYVLSALVLASLFAYLNFSSWTKRFLVVFFALAVAIVANWIRAYLIVLLGHFSHMKYGTGDDHVWYGWLIFGAVMGFVFWFAARYADQSTLNEITKTELGSKLPPSLESPVVPKGSTGPSQFPAIFWLLAGALVIATSSLPSDAMRNFDVKRGLEKQLSSLGPSLTTANFVFPVGFESALEKSSFRVNEVHGAVNYFALQHKNTDMLASGQKLFEESLGRLYTIDRGTGHVGKDGQGFKVRASLVKVNQETFAVWHWFVVGKSSVTSPYLAKAARLVNLVRFHGDHSSVVVLAVRADSLKDGEKALGPVAASINQLVSDWQTK